MKAMLTVREAKKLHDKVKSAADAGVVVLLTGPEAEHVHDCLDAVNEIVIGRDGPMVDCDALTGTEAEAVSPNTAPCPLCSAAMFWPLRVNKPRATDWCSECRETASELMLGECGNGAVHDCPTERLGHRARMMVASAAMRDLIVSFSTNRKSK